MCMLMCILCSISISRVIIVDIKHPERGPVRVHALVRR